MYVASTPDSTLVASASRRILRSSLSSPSRSATTKTGADSVTGLPAGSATFATNVWLAKLPMSSPLTSRVYCPGTAVSLAFATLTVLPPCRTRKISTVEPGSADTSRVIVVEFVRLSEPYSADIPDGDESSVIPSITAEATRSTTMVSVSEALLPARSVTVTLTDAEPSAMCSRTEVGLPPRSSKRG